MKRLALAAVLLLTSCGGSSVPKDGFGKVRYGMTVAELKQAGLTCETETECLDDHPAADPGNETPFSKPDRITANLTKGAVSSIDLMFLMYGDDEMIAAYTKVYGKPAVCRYQNALAATVERNVWSASNGATITVSKVLDYGVSPNLGGLTARSSSATYRDPDQSRDFKSHSC